MITTTYDTALVTTEEAKAVLRITDSVQDPEVGRLVASVSASVSRWCRRRFEILTHALWFDGTGDSILQFPHWPLITPVTSVGAGVQDALEHGIWLSQSRAVNSSTKLTECLLDGSGTGNGYVLNTGERGRGAIEYVQGSKWPRGQRNIFARLPAGYAAGSIPPDVKEACLVWIGVRAGRGADKSWGVTSRTVTAGGGSETLREKDMPDEVVGMLEPYRRKPRPVFAGAAIGSVA